MKAETAQEIIDCLPRGKTGYRYYKDRYAAMLLTSAIDEQARISDLKRSVFARLLDRPLIREQLASSGDGIVRRRDLDYLWQEPSVPFLLTLSTWHGETRWDQTTRKGVNLVLQLNFTSQHDRAFHSLARPEDYHAFRSFGHPVMQPFDREFFRETLAWARIDLDLATGEALIEEIQNDWLRRANKWIAYLQRLERCNGPVADRYGLRASAKSIRSYIQQVLKPYHALWDEAMLSAAIRFIHDELGLREIYYHDWATGAKLKNIRYDRPPRSVYSQLPKRFCFQPTTQTPAFLLQDRYFQRICKRRRWTDLQWQKLSLDQQWGPQALTGGCDARAA